MTAKNGRSDLARLAAARSALSDCMDATVRRRGIETLAVRADCCTRLLPLLTAVMSFERIVVGIDPRPNGFGERRISRLISTVDLAVERTYRRLEKLPHELSAAGKVADSVGEARGA